MEIGSLDGTVFFQVGLCTPLRTVQFDPTHMCCKRFGSSILKLHGIFGKSFVTTVLLGSIGIIPIGVVSHCVTPSFSDGGWWGD